MFASLKERFLGTSSWVPRDEYDKVLADLLETGTSELLISPDWGTNMEVVDLVNRNPSIIEEKLLSALKRNMQKDNAKVQILTLTESTPFDNFAGMSQEDRIAVEAAMREMEGMGVAEHLPPAAAAPRSAPPPSSAAAYGNAGMMYGMGWGSQQYQALNDHEAEERGTHGQVPAPASTGYMVTGSYAPPNMMSPEQVAAMHSGPTGAVLG
eukprot:gene8485-4845_t